MVTQKFLKEKKETEKCELEGYIVPDYIKKTIKQDTTNYVNKINRTTCIDRE